MLINYYTKKTMKLNYREIPSNLGGAALTNCGTIHLSEVQPTLDQLTADISYPIPLSARAVGSTGKRDYSGDIDLVLDPIDGFADLDELKKILIDKFGSDNVRRLGSLICIRYPIVGYNPLLDEFGPRTGYVQVDFNTGNYEWESFFYYSAGNQSAYKSLHRNIAISSLSGAVDREQSDELDSFGRPVRLVRWKWSIHGFCKIVRQSKLRDDGLGTVKKQEDTVIDGPYFDKDFIAKKLLPVSGTVDDLESLESILAAVKVNYSPEAVGHIFQSIANAIFEWDKKKEFIYPPEIAELMPLE